MSLVYIRAALVILFKKYLLFNLDNIAFLNFLEVFEEPTGADSNPFL